MSNTTSVRSRLRQPVAVGRKGHQLVGGVPQVSLLPGEVREAGAVAAHRRKLVALVAVAAVVATGGVALSQTMVTSAQQRLAAAQAQSATLNAQVAKFNDLRTLQSQIALGQAAVRVGSSTMIDWRDQLDRIEADMPAGYSIAAISANGATPFATYAQGSDPLEPTRAATVALTITAPSIGEEFSTWLRDLRTIPAYADATANTSYDASANDYTIALTMHLTDKAISAGSWAEKK